METIIDAKKSINSKRLTYKSGVEKADLLIMLFCSILMIGLALILLISKFNSMPIPVLLLVIGFISWMIANVVLFNTLVKVIGIDINNNRSDIIRVLNEHFTLNLSDNNQTIIMDVRPSGFIHWGRVITVLLDDNSVYINIKTLGRADGISPFHGFINYLKCKRIEKQLLQLQQTKVKT